MPDRTERLDKLREMLDRNPQDTFVLYAMGLEYRKLGQTDDALAYLRRTLDTDPGYCVAHQMMGQLYEQLGLVEAARKAYQDGIRAARANGDAHAAREMEEALAVLP